MSKQHINKMQLAFNLYAAGRYLPLKRGQKKLSVKDIAAQLQISNINTVRGYIWRIKHPDSYKACVQRYFQRLRAARDIIRKQEQTAAAKKTAAEEKRLAKSPAFKAALKQSKKAEKKQKAEAAASGAETRAFLNQVHEEVAAIGKKVQQRKK